MNYELIETASDEDFVNHSVKLLKEHISEAIENHDSCILGLSGGSTPRPIYEALGKEDLDWSKVWIFLADERCIAPDDSDSNQKLVRDTLLQHAPIPEDHFIFPDTSLPMDECIQKYASDLQDLWKEYLPDIIILGMGPDGHITSLFPPLDDAALGDEQLVLHTTTDQFAVRDRISISLNAVSAAKKQIFFLKGEGKKKVWEEMMESEEDERRWPAKRVLKTGDVMVITQW